MRQEICSSSPSVRRCLLALLIVVTFVSLWLEFAPAHSDGTEQGSSENHLWKQMLGHSRNRNISASNDYVSKQPENLKLLGTGADNTVDQPVKQSEGQAEGAEQNNEEKHISEHAKSVLANQGATVPEETKDKALDAHTSQGNETLLSPFPPLPPPDVDERMAICISVKNQADALDEFLIHHYHHQGIRRFYVHDDGSDSRLSERTYGIPSSAITWYWHEPWPHNPNAEDRGGIQEKYFGECIDHHREKHNWMGFLDADEFIEMTGNETLAEFLGTFELDNRIGAVAMNWVLHTSAGLLKRPTTTSRKAYHKCIIDNPDNDNRLVKSWVKTMAFKRMFHVHCMAEMEGGAVEVGENWDIIQFGCNRRPITRDRIALHHYATKSREEFEEKMQRGHIQGGGASEGWWQMVEGEEQWTCDSLTKYVP